MGKIIFSILISIMILSNANANVKYILGIEEFEGEAVMIVCGEDDLVYAKLDGTLIKAAWENEGVIEQLKCEDYTVWKDQNNEK